MIRSVWLALLILLAILWTPSVAMTQPSVTPSADNSQPTANVQDDDPWAFLEEDEEENPGWGELIRAQAVDLGFLSAFIALVLISFFRRSTRLRYITLVFALVYLGFFKSQLISIVNVYSLTTLNLPIFKYNLSWYLFIVFSLVSTVLWGRLYCGRICAYGALTQLLDLVVPVRWRIDVPAKIERRASLIKYVLLGGTLLYFIVTHDISIYRYVEPFWMFTFQASTALWVGLGLLLIATVFVRNLYCRFLCPVGAFLGLLSHLTVFRIKRWSECNTCKICEKTCEWGAIRGPKIVVTECVRCDDCEQLYMDKQRCPHWIIIQRKEDILARQGTIASSAQA
jgi:NosR/NirI family nitrous oxide reductase transcriptional regulator